MLAAGRIAEKYLSEKRYLRVVIPDIANPTEEDARKALETAVVQPAFEASSPDGPIFLSAALSARSKSRSRGKWLVAALVKFGTLLGHSRSACPGSASGHPHRGC